MLRTRERGPAMDAWDGDWEGTRVRDGCVHWGSAEGLMGVGQGGPGVSHGGVQGPKDKGQRDQEYPTMWDECPGWALEVLGEGLGAWGHRGSCPKAPGHHQRRSCGTTVAPAWPGRRGWRSVSGSGPCATTPGTLPWPCGPAAR